MRNSVKPAQSSVLDRIKGLLPLIGLLLNVLFSLSAFAQSSLPDPIAYYPLDYGGGTDTELFKEKTGQRTATGKGGAITGVADRFNSASKAIQFSSPTAHLSLPSFAQTLRANQGFSVSFWTKIDEDFSPPANSPLPYIDSDPRYQIFYANDATNGTPQFGMQRVRDRLGVNRYLPNTAAKQPWLLWLWDPVAFQSLSNNATFTPHGWYHIILTYYRNGMQVWMWKPGTSTAACSRNYFWPQDLSKATIWGLGNIDTSKQSIKYLDDVKFFDVPLNDDQAAALHTIESLPPPQTTYCSSVASSSSQGWIGELQVGSQKRFSGNDGGYQYLSERENWLGIAREGTTQVRVKKLGGNDAVCPTGNCNPSDKYRIWIDYDQSGTFENEELAVDQTDLTHSKQSTANVRVPVTARLGLTRMRVSLNGSGDPQQPCQTLNTGDVKDYTVMVYTGGQLFQPDGYCPPTAYDDDTDPVWLQSVVVKTLNSQLNSVNTQISKNSYADFTDQQATLYNSLILRPSDPVSLSLKPNRADNTQQAQYKIWIDYNRDGDFEDSNENVFSKTSTVESVISGNFTVPNQFSPGVTRMRVKVYTTDAAADPCLRSFPAGGEVKDFKVTLENGNGPCLASGDGQKAWIQSVSINGGEKVTGNNSGYKNLTNEVLATIKKGAIINQSYAVSTRSNDYVSVKSWIDFNGDGTFDDTPGSDEIIFYETLPINSQTSQVFSGNFLVPEGATNGNVLMRTIIRSGLVSSASFFPCGSALQGEVEDYVIDLIDETPNSARALAHVDTTHSNIIRSETAPDTLEVAKLTVYPNPTQADFTLDFYLPEAETAYVEIVDLQGRVLWYSRQKYSAGKHQLTNNSLIPASCNCSSRPGVYIVNLTTSNYRISRRLLVK